MSFEEGYATVEGNMGQGSLFGIGNDTEEMVIADVLVYSSFGREIITAIGGNNYDDGLGRVLGELQGAEDDEVSSVFDYESSFWSRLF